jgi:hypothetical protein
MTAVEGVVVAVVSAVLEDLVLLLQPARANPARSKVNNVVFFIGGLNCDPTDPGITQRFAIHLGRLPLKSCRTRDIKFAGFSRHFTGASAAALDPVCLQGANETRVKRDDARADFGREAAQPLLDESPHNELGRWLAESFGR